MPPAIHPDANTRVAPISSSVWLPCSVTGIPSPTVYWLKDSLHNLNSSRVFVLSNGTLFIHDAKKTDTGSYKCVAENEGGRDEQDVYLDIECKMTSFLRVFLYFDFMFLRSTSSYFCAIQCNSSDRQLTGMAL